MVITMCDGGSFWTAQIKWTASGSKQTEVIDFLLPICYSAGDSKWSCRSPRLSRDSALIFAVLLQMSESGQMSVSHTAEAQPRVKTTPTSPHTAFKWLNTSRHERCIFYVWAPQTASVCTPGDDCAAGDTIIGGGDKWGETLKWKKINK